MFTLMKNGLTHLKTNLLQTKKTINISDYSLYNTYYCYNFAIRFKIHNLCLEFVSLQEKKQ